MPFVYIGEVDCIEVSDGTIRIPLKEKLVFIENFFKIIQISR